ncbi:MAG: 3-isopropylmalate dehydratase small subunit [Pseudomonadota bacterium]|nr:3-isopropylmalate dehydratase small subunit [Pseudomonadota bacterium]
MKAFVSHQGLVGPMDLANVDTDMIIPKQFLKSIKRSGFGPYLFDEMRYLDEGWYGKDCGTRPLNPDFALNQERYQGTSILLARENFGCGSSREHAPWALDDFGIRAIVAPSFADIFYNNCFKNGMLPIILDKAVVDGLFRDVAAGPGYQLTIDLPAQTITKPSGEVIPFEIDAFRKQCLLEGLDEIGLTLKEADKIRAFEARHRAAQPWMFDAIK